eukprot:TRINITY_DN4558_c1_g1_i1.p2 TRINITY_DN4558_c1_g1~~TRINITY_DN4558_c1_g1_i1.p2  ORF type:complete len:129 (-),score=31.50 TRINITY_DN4558_c1_g1_i1:61-447(-)
MRKDALKIYQTFIVPSAATAVNLPYDARQSLVNQFTRTLQVQPSARHDVFLAVDDSSMGSSSNELVLKPDVFEAARSCSFKLMKQDSFLRFKRTTAFKNWHQQQQQQRERSTTGDSMLASLKSMVTSK